MGGAAWFGLALISGSKLVLSLAVVRYLANWWFLTRVEKYAYIHFPFHHLVSKFLLHQSPHAKAVRRLSEEGSGLCQGDEERRK